jgi:hypothetical protein
MIMNTFSKSVRWIGAVLVSLTLLTSCGGGASTSENPQTTNNSGSVNASSYTGPVALTTDIRAFQVNVWDPLRATNRCGACHFVGGQSPTFARQDDVNLAYADVGGLVDLDAPASSRLVTKVGGGHNCWLTSNAACATIVQNYIEDWANGVAGGQREIQLAMLIHRQPRSLHSLRIRIRLLLMRPMMQLNPRWI